MISEEQKQQLDAMFKFKCGDVVKLYGSAPNLGVFDRYREQRWLVVTRWVEQCPGGVQLYYVCTVISPVGSAVSEVFRFHEVQLVASEPFASLE